MVGALVGISVNLVILFGFFFYFRSRLDRAVEARNILRDIRAEVDEMIVELNQTTDRNVGLVEDQLSRLSARMAEVDRRIVVLKKEGEKAKAADAVYTHLRPTAPPAPRAAKGTAAKADRPAEPAPPPKKKSTREQVLDLYRSGLEAKEIATKLDKTLGEVELIISLGTNRS